MPPLENLYQQFKDQGFVVIGIESWSRGGAMRLKLYEQQFGVTFPLLYDGPPWGYPAIGTPTVALLDRKSRVVGWRTGECDWHTGPVKELVRMLLAEPG